MTRVARAAVSTALAGLLAAPCAFGSADSAQGDFDSTAPSARAARGSRAPIERVVLRQIAAFAEIGRAPLVGPERQALSRNVAPTEDPHAAGVACDRDLNRDGVTPGERQVLLDAARRLGAIPKFHFGPKRSRSGRTWGVSGDVGHFEWDPVALGYPPVPALIAARLVADRRPVHQTP